MGRVSKRPISPEVEQRMFEIFRNYFASLKKPEDIQEFLISLLSHTEQVMLAKRLAIAVLLSRGFNYEEIDQALKVSKSTVGSVHKQILVGAGGYNKAVKEILNEENQENLWNKLEEIVLSLLPPKNVASNSFKRKQEKGKKLAKRKRQLSAL